jgi:hypothetical protein
MANIFPRWSNFVIFKLAIIVGVLGMTVIIGYAYFYQHPRVGYSPAQPVPFSHALHVGQNGMDCRYCHSHVEHSPISNIPTNQTCTNCHGAESGQVALDSLKLAPIREAAESGLPIEWVNVHVLPDYAYFDHSVHVSRGVSCASCHGRVDEMEVVSHHSPLTMGWCLDCHRAPEKHVRPTDQVFNMAWEPADESRDTFYGGLAESGVSPSAMYAMIERAAGLNAPSEGGEIDLALVLEAAKSAYGDSMTQEEIGKQLVAHWHIAPPESCAACHR